MLTEAETKIHLIRDVLERHDLAAVRLRGVDWFAWATCGGSSVVILTAEVGVAEVLITADAALVLTDSVEADRLRAEEIPAEFTIWSAPWYEHGARERFVAAQVNGRIASDRPGTAEEPLPAALLQAKRRLLPAEIERYRTLGALAAVAMTEVMTAARPEWTEQQLAGAGAEALWGRGIHPTLTLVGGERRLDHYRHLTATAERLGGRAMLVFCARQHGLYANLTRFVQFREASAAEQARAAAVAQLEAAAWKASVPGATLGNIYTTLVQTYAELGYAGSETGLHFGGTTGYLAREVVAVPGGDQAQVVIEANTALAWNPSLTGAKIEDTILVNEQGLEILTLDPAWPMALIEGRLRPRAYDA